MSKRRRLRHFSDTDEYRVCDVSDDDQAGHEEQNEEEDTRAKDTSWTEDTLRMIGEFDDDYKVREGERFAAWSERMRILFADEDQRADEEDTQPDR